MKYLKHSLLALLAVTPSVFAATGSAIIPSWTSVNYGSSSNESYFVLHISNITPVQTDVSLRLFDKSGNVYQKGSGDAFTINNASSLNYGTTDDTVTLSIGPNSTIDISVLTGAIQSGYGVIEWQQDSAKTVNALVANGTQLVYKSDFSHRSERTIPINNGLSF